MSATQSSWFIVFYEEVEKNNQTFYIGGRKYNLQREKSPVLLCGPKIFQTEILGYFDYLGGFLELCWEGKKPTKKDVDRYINELCEEDEEGQTEFSRILEKQTKKEDKHTLKKLMQMVST